MRRQQTFRMHACLHLPVLGRFLRASALCLRHLASTASPPLQVTRALVCPPDLTDMRAKRHTVLNFCPLPQLYGNQTTAHTRALYKLCDTWH